MKKSLLLLPLLLLLASCSTLEERVRETCDLAESRLISNEEGGQQLDLEDSENVISLAVYGYCSFFK